MKKILKLFQFYRFSSLNLIFKYLIFHFFKILNSKGSIIINIYDYKMHIPMQYDGIGRALYIYRSRELDHKWIIDKELTNGNIVLDLGANIGYYAIMEAKKIGKTAKIYAIEPDPRNFEYLKKNISLNKLEKIFEIEQGAISNKTQQAEFLLSSKTNLSSFNLNKKEINSNSIMVQTYDLGEYLKNKRRIDLIRMDIEGHEIEVFESLINFSNNFKNHLPKKIIFETHFPIYVNKKEYVIDIFTKLFNIGYYIKYFSSIDEPKEKFLRNGYTPFKIINDFPFQRGIYKNIDHKDFINFITDYGGIRTVLLELK